MYGSKQEKGKIPGAGLLSLMCGIVFAAFLIFMVGGMARPAHAEMAYGYILPESSWEYLTGDEIADMPLQVVCYAKNEIYARNGRMFVSSELQNYFDEQYWYCRVYSPSQFSDGMLNVYEMANVALLSQREQQLGTYALDSGYYDYSSVYQYIYDHSYRYYEADGYWVDPDSYIFYDSDRRYISEAEMSQLSLQELCYAKNEIYARRGRMFVSQELTGYFDQKNWYWGTIAPEYFSENMLNSYEAANAAALQRAENARQSGGYILDQYGYSYAGVGAYRGYNEYVPSTSEYLYWDSNIRYLEDAEAASMTLQQLNYARNEIYARRGYIFQSQELRDYFGSKNWYHGIIAPDQFSTSIFNDYEKANIELLKRYEYAISPNGYQLY